MPDQDLLSRLRQRFADKRSFNWTEEWPLGDTQSGASVLIALMPGPADLSVVLTRRADHLYHHPGQISFPGGRIEAGDSSAIATALRETQEEIGLRADQIEVLGVLPDYGTSSGFRVTPVVGLVPQGFEPVLDAFEVAELFSVPLPFLLDPTNYQQHRVERGSIVRHFHAVPWPGRFIWGATAGMLAMFAAFMAEEKTAPSATSSTRHDSPDLGAPAPALSGSGVYSG